MTAPHDPTPEFADRAERELARTLRTAGAFDRRIAGPPRAVWIVLLAVGAALLGAGGAVAAERLRSEREAALIVRRAEVRLRAAERHSDLSKERLTLIEARAAAGVVSQTELMHARAAARRVESERRRLALDLEEVRASRRVLNDSLSAPLVDGRDFVNERLGLSHEDARAAVEDDEELLVNARRRFEMGVTSQDEVFGSELRAGISRARAVAIEEKLALRRRFQNGMETAERVDLLGMRADAEAAKTVGRLKLEVTRKRLQFAERAYAAGIIGMSEITKLKTRVEEAQQEIDLAQIDLEILELD